MIITKNDLLFKRPSLVHKSSSFYFSAVFLKQLYDKLHNIDSDELKRQTLTIIRHFATHNVDTAVDMLINDLTVPFDDPVVKIWRSLTQEQLLASRVMKRLLHKICPMMEGGMLEENQIFAMVNFL